VLRAGASFPTAREGEEVEIVNVNLSARTDDGFVWDFDVSWGLRFTDSEIDSGQEFVNGLVFWEWDDGWLADSDPEKLHTVPNDTVLTGGVDINNMVYRTHTWRAGVSRLSTELGNEEIRAEVYLQNRDGGPVISLKSNEVTIGD